MSAVKCECGEPYCRIKINVESDREIMMTGKDGDDSLMYTNKQSRRKLCSQFDSDNTLARDLVALLFWRWRSNRAALRKTQARNLKEGDALYTFMLMQSCYESESWNAYVQAKDYLYSKTKGDE
jgi:hypothetical protein